MRADPFDRFHPAVALAYFAAMLAFGMAAVQPVYLLVAFASATAFGVAVRGWRRTLRALAWQLPLVLVVAGANLLFSPIGASELFRIGSRAFYFESLAFGACMGLMLASVLAWFSNASAALSSDKVMGLFGAVAPTVGLMLSMTMRLVPRFVRRGSDIAAVQRACTAALPAAGAAKSDGVRARLRQTSVLMGWSMEDSLETASAMKARGWGAAARRTSYRRSRFRRADAVALACGGMLALAGAALAWAACGQFRFYPTIGGYAPWWNYLPYALLAFSPIILAMKERAQWRTHRP